MDVRAEKLGIKRQSVGSIILKYTVEEVVKSKRDEEEKIDHTKLIKDVRFYGESYRANATITLKEIQSRMVTELPGKPRVTDQTISEKLDG